MPPKSLKRKAANGYKMPEKIPEGTLLTTLSKKQFRVGKSIGVGGFGEIYLCSEDVSRPVGDDAIRALKIEPHENGPLFVEMNFYIRAASPESIADFKKTKGLASLGMPCHRGSGSVQFNGDKYRFLIMDRFGSDLQKIFQTGKHPFSDQVTCNLAIKIIDVLEYIHSQGYAHNDIKAQNLLLGFGKGNEHEVYLVDFGLATKYLRGGEHLEYKADPKKAHDGTIEYTSRDAHIGTHSRRSDFEILGYNLVHWMSGTLPWMSNLTNPDNVFNQKKTFMADINAAMKKCFGTKQIPDFLSAFLNYVKSLEFNDAPDYEKSRKFFSDALKKAKYPLDGKVDFAIAKSSPVKSTGGTSTPRSAAARRKEPVVMPAKLSPTKRSPRIKLAGSETPKSAIKKSPAKRSRLTPKSPKMMSARSETPKPNGVSKFKESGTQTSPAFVKAAKAAARSRKGASSNSEIEEFAKMAVSAAKKATSAKRLAKESPKSEAEEASSGLSNPTPAMAALLAKRAADADKGTKRRKKVVA